MNISAGQTQGWSFGLRHDPSSLQTAGGDCLVAGVTTEGTGVAQVKNGEPADFDSTKIFSQDEGFTQGIVIDMGSQVTLDPCEDFVTALACYQVNTPTETGYYEVPIFFTHDLGDPATESTVAQEGFSNDPCAYNLTLGVYVSSYSQNYPACTLGGGPGTSESSQYPVIPEAEEPVQESGVKDEGAGDATVPCSMPESFVASYVVVPNPAGPNECETIAEARDKIAQFIEQNGGDPGPYLIELKPDSQNPVHSEDPVAFTRTYLRGNTNPSSPITIVIRSGLSVPVTWKPETPPTESPLLWARDVSIIVKDIEFDGIVSFKAVLAVIGAEVKDQEFTVYLKNCRIAGEAQAPSAGLAYVQSDLDVGSGDPRYGLVCVEDCEVLYAASGSFAEGGAPFDAPETWPDPQNWSDQMRMPEWGGAVSISGFSNSPTSDWSGIPGRFNKIAIVDSVSPGEEPKYKGNMVLAEGNLYSPYLDWAPAGGCIGVYADFSELKLSNLFIDGDSGEGKSLSTNAVRGGGVFIGTECKTQNVQTTTITLDNCKIEYCTAALSGEANEDPRTSALGGALCVFQSGGASVDGQTYIQFSMEDCSFSHNRARIPDEESETDVTAACSELFYSDSAPGCRTARGGAVALVAPSRAVETSFANVTIRGTVFKQNEAATAGGALFLRAPLTQQEGQPAITIEEVTVTGNSQRVPSALVPYILCDFDVEGWREEMVYLTYPPRSGGGAFYLAPYGIDDWGEPASFDCIIEDTTFTDNRSAAAGGAVLVDGVVLPFDLATGDPNEEVCPVKGHRGQWLFNRLTFINNSSDAMIEYQGQTPAFVPQGHAIYFARLPSEGCVKFFGECTEFWRNLDPEKPNHAPEPKWQVSNCFIRHDTWDIAHVTEDLGREISIHGAPLGSNVNLYFLGNTIDLVNADETKSAGCFSVADESDVPQWPDDPGDVLSQWWGGYRILSDILWAEAENGGPDHYGLYPHREFDPGQEEPLPPYSNDSEDRADRIVLGTCVHGLPQYLAGQPPGSQDDPENYEEDPMLYVHGHIDHQSPCIDRGVEQDYKLIIGNDAAPFPDEAQGDYDGRARVGLMDSGADESEWQGFRRGEINQDGGINIADPIALLGYLFGGKSLDCLDAGDVNDDGKLNIADPIYLLGYLFGGGDPPRPPFGECGEDPTPDTVGRCYFNVDACP